MRRLPRFEVGDHISYLGHLGTVVNAGDTFIRMKLEDGSQRFIGRIGKVQPVLVRRASYPWRNK